MKTLVLALLVPLAICTACAKKEESSATPAPAPVEAAANSLAVSTGPDISMAPAAAGNASATGAPLAQGPNRAQVSLVSATGSSVKGDLDLTGEGLSVSIRGEITGLAPGKEHGFHVHEGGECSLPDFKSAGEHFNPTKDPHGGPKSTARHLGDMPNARADENGRATIDISVMGVRLVDNDGGPNQILGKALVVHALPDDYKTQPSGGSGDRIACGVIR